MENRALKCEHMTVLSEIEVVQLVCLRVCVSALRIQHTLSFVCGYRILSYMSVDAIVS